MRRAFTLVLSILALAALSGCKGNLNTGCIPECGGAECGNDGCGGVCGECGSGFMCETGNCVSIFCGNGRIDPQETCDPALVGSGEGVCPTMCEDDGNACTNEQFFGRAETCDATCRVTMISQCNTDASDNCCPTGCTSSNDTDCSVDCGNGELDGSETCDPPDSCPEEADCDDGDACTTDSLTGAASTCSAECANVPLDDEDCNDDESDGCCPPGCTDQDDVDCESVCGDGEVTGNETCDSAIAEPDEGFCPTDEMAHCDDQEACTSDEIQGTVDDCDAMCVNVAITDATDGDGCCVDPDNMTSDMDDDCPDPAAVCGNTVVEAGETCDSAIAAGDDGYCPANDAECDDMDACTMDAMIGVVNDCTAECEYTDVMMPTPEDGCCYFAGLVSNEIVDCQTLCDDYCTAAITNCPDVPIYMDDNASGDAMDECQTACAAFGFPVGPPPGVDADADADGNTLTCRIYHLGLADPNDMATQMTHCPHAEAMSAVCNVDL